MTARSVGDRTVEVIQRATGSVWEVMFGDDDALGCRFALARAGATTELADVRYGFVSWSGRGFLIVFQDPDAARHEATVSESTWPHDDYDFTPLDESANAEALAVAVVEAVLSMVDETLE